MEASLCKSQGQGAGTRRAASPSPSPPPARARAPLASRCLKVPLALSRPARRCSAKRNWAAISRASASSSSSSSAKDAASTKGEGGSDLDAGYNQEMQEKMGGSLTYEHERGMNYTRILPQLIVGSCLQTGEDAAWLREKEKVRGVLCLQQDSDMEYFSLDLNPVLRGCERVGITHVRCRVNDFDPHDLRLKLPSGVAALDKAMRECEDGECVYVHCTAGLGRAPGVSIAYMYWVLGMPLMEAHRVLTSQRPCHPKLDAIRHATCDLIFGGGTNRVKVGMKAPVSAKEVLVAGLDMGWDNPAQCKRDGDRFVLERSLPAGRFQYKYIVDGKWTYCADSPVTTDDGGNSNNFVDVVAMGDPVADYVIRSRLMAQEADLSDAERSLIVEKIRSQ